MRAIGIVVLLALSFCGYVATAKNVHVTMQARWTETPFTAEACEAVAASAGNAGFFSCMSAVQRELDVLKPKSPRTSDPTSLEAFLDSSMTQEKMYSVAVKVVDAITPPKTAALVRAELAGRIYSPKVEAHQELSRQHPDGSLCAEGYFAVVASGAIYCNMEDAVAFARGNRNCDNVNNTVSEMVDIDHVFPGSSEDPCAKVIVYGNLGSAVFTAQHAILTTAVTSGGDIRYLFRHAVVANGEGVWDSPLRLQGYGVTLDVKNMEYKAVDEKKPVAKSSADQQQDTQPIDDAVIAGFDIAKLKQRKPSLNVGLSDFAADIAERIGKEEEDVSLDLQVWELQQLGFQAAMHVLKSKTQLETLHDVLTNFPLRAGKLSKLTFGNNAFKTLSQQLMPLQRMFGEGSNAVFLNGRGLPEDKFDYYSLMSELRKEESYLGDLERIMLYSGIKQAVINASSEYELNYYLNRVKGCQLQKTDRREKPKRFWVEATRVTWLNDLTKDPFFAEAGTSVKDLLRTNMYGQPQFPKKNIFHAIYIIDPASREGLEVVSGITRMVRGGSAARIAIALVDRGFSTRDERHVFTTAFTVDGQQVATDDADALRPSVSALIQAVAFSLEDDTAALLDFLNELYRGAVKEDISEDLVRTTAAAFLPDGMLLDTVAANPGFYLHYREHNRYFKTIGIKHVPVLVFNGLLLQENLQQAFYQGFQQEFQVVRDFVMRQVLDDTRDDIYTFLMTAHGAMSRYQPAIYDRVKYIPLRHTAQVKFLEMRPMLRSADYDGQPSLLTHILMVPATPTIDSILMIDRALQHLSECTQCPGVQLTLAACQSARGAGPVSNEIIRVIEGTLLQTVGDGKMQPVTGKEVEQLNVLRKLTAAIIEFVNKTFTPKEMHKLAFTDEVAGAVVESLRQRSDMPPQVKQALGNLHVLTSAAAVIVQDFCEATRQDDSRKLVGSATFILTNGRITIVDDSFLSDDYMLLEVEEGQRTQSVYGCIESVDIASLLVDGMKPAEVTKMFIATKLSAVSSVAFNDLVTRGARMEKFYLPYPTTPYSFIASSHLPQNARHTLNAVINPIARESQHIASLVRHFATTMEALGLASVVYLNPPSEMQKVPISNFYQLVVQKEPQFDSRGLVMSPSAYFRNMPQAVTLTMGLVEPEAWLVFASWAKQDLDNIRLNTVPVSTLRAEYTLRNILLTGSCDDVTTEQRPRGLPIVMTKRPGVLVGTDGVTDTLVMSNYGYFQLQGGPGVWHLAVQPGTASSIYEVVDVEEKDASSVWSAYYAPRRTSKTQFSSKPVAITSFLGKHVTLRVQKKEGQEQRDLLASLKAESESEEALVSWPPADGPRTAKPTKPTLNIFSVASGHLYERFLRMMFHTVMKSSSDIHGANTTRIKFWLIENFLSPHFKEFVPKMAEKYGFDYGFVTYRWPHWLRRQTEKQRTIWGYKILFLDVLFPLDVDKVIFVDADQVVKSDLHELYHLDLEGHAVAYTPFCRKNRNEDTKGFRFWDQGFWSDHLQGKPYHISAIYVVDLKRLRMMAAGDQYRMVYENLSADPNSLANLDQDLPNFAQHQVPIFSLPEEWLWCETWCNQESKESAKTIDLCNNPLTKTPKLENAKRIIPDWEETDAMLEKLVE